LHFRDKNLFVCVLAFAIIFSGCASNEPPDQQSELKTIIAKYNNAIVEAYKNQNFEYLTQVATEEELNKIGIIINSYRQSDQIMEAEIRKIDFREVKIDGDKAVVKTSEDWSYRWLNYKTGQEVEPPQDIHYELLYQVIKKDGKWLVDAVEEIKEGNKS